MPRFFTRERFGRHQFYAGLLLTAFLAQALWLARAELRGSSTPGKPEAVRIAEGWKQWHGNGIAGAPFAEQRSTFAVAGDAPDVFDSRHSPLLYLASSAPLLIWPEPSTQATNSWRWLARLPFLACGLLLGASLWYVARRLCGNTGGLVALTLYCFSPGIIQAASLWHRDPEIVPAWGAFGTVFTAIAVAHTLYAPREVVLWNWRRILLLGTAFAIAIGSEFSLIILLPIALAFLLYVAPVRKRAGFVIWLAACVIGLVLVVATYFFRLDAFANAMRHAVFWGTSWQGFAMAEVYKQIAIDLARECPALLFVLPAAFLIYAWWRRTRYFGNTAPLLTAVGFVLLAIAHPHSGSEGFVLAAIPFLLVFVGGVLADLMETRQRSLVASCVFGLLAAYCLWNVSVLAFVPPG